MRAFFIPSLSLLLGGGLTLGEGVATPPSQPQQEKPEPAGAAAPAKAAEETPPTATLTVVKFREPDEAEVTLEITNNSGRELYMLEGAALQPVHDLEWIKEGKWVAHMMRTSCTAGLNYRRIAPGGKLQLEVLALKYEEFRYCLFLCYQRSSGEWRQMALRTRSIKLEETPHLAQAEWSTGLVVLHPPAPEDAQTKEYPSGDPLDPFAPSHVSGD